jgi:hypothetical protein
MPVGSSGRITQSAPGRTAFATVTSAVSVLPFECAGKDHRTRGVRRRAGAFISDIRRPLPANDDDLRTIYLLLSRQQL